MRNIRQRVGEVFRTMRDMLRAKGNAAPLRRDGNKAEERRLMHEGQYPLDGGFSMPGITDVQTTETRRK